MAERSVRLISKQTSVPGRIPTGTTGNESNFIRQGELAQNTADRKLFGFDGASIFEFGSNSFLGLTGGTISGNLRITSNLSAGTYYSGSTPLETIIANIASNNENTTYVQPGLNTYTGGTASLPTVNVSAATLSYLSATTISGGTLYSGGTEISTLFGSASAAAILQSQILTKANRSGDTFTGQVNAPAFSVTTISGGTYYSGSTPLETIIANIASNNENTTYVQPGLNTYTGGTPNYPTINISAATLSYLSATTISGDTLYSGGTEISTLFGSASAVATSQSQILTKTNRSGDTFTGQVNAPAFSASTISGGTYYSGNTPLETIIANIASNNENTTYVQPGLNTYTGGTASLPTVNVSAATLSYLSATTISGGTYYSGSTPLETIINNIANSIEQNDITRVQPGLNTYTGGTANLPTVNISAATLTYLSATTISGGTIYSGGTDLYNIFATIGSFTGSGASTYVQPGLNTYTGGTPSLPTINISAATLSYLSASTISGDTIYSGNTEISTLFGSSAAVTTLQSQILTKANRSGDTFTGQVNAPAFSATTISGGTYYSGSTPLETIITNIANAIEQNDITRVQPGLNTYTGGTANNPTVNISAATLSYLSATTVSASTFYSGSTNLETIFHNKNGYLLQKAGSVSGSTFAGNPKKATVTFTSNFVNDNYAVSVIADVSRTWSIESKTLSGFTINANANTAFSSGNVFWQATEIGEGYK